MKFRTLAKTAYQLVLFIRYFPVKGLRKIRVANSRQILFYNRSLITVPIRKMRVGIPRDPETEDQPNTSLPLLKSQHYKFAKNYLLNKSEENAEDYERFARSLIMANDVYCDIGLNSLDYVNNFEKLIKIISNTGYLPKENPIIVWPRIWKNDYIIMDGAHRAGILAAMGQEEIECVVFLWKKVRPGPPAILKL